MFNPFLRVHLTNVVGSGAVQLALSLLPALERSRRIRVKALYLPNRGGLSNYRGNGTVEKIERYTRLLPNALSRIIECLFLSYAFEGKTPLLVLGDLPLRALSHQFVFVQNSFLLKPKKMQYNLDGLRHALYRVIFELNAGYICGVIVQTERMKNSLIESYPGIAKKIFVISQPVPAWLENEGVKTRNIPVYEGKLKLFYPAANYQHKNHKLISDISACKYIWPVEWIKLTLTDDEHPAPSIPWVLSVGNLSGKEMVLAYKEADALLFLSLEESYGFPLVEAMFMGLPIICPDLPYARALCLDGAIYFDPLSIESLHDAVSVLHKRLCNNWHPDWSIQLGKIPSDWDEVADKLIDVVCNVPSDNNP
jgi:glycosyltransferase involved in cell wall biosynthesis